MTPAVHVYWDMSRTAMARGARAVGLAALLVSAGGCTVQLDGHAFIERVEKRFPAGTAPEISLATFDGSIQVRPWDRPEAPPASAAQRHPVVHVSHTDAIAFFNPR